MKQIYLLLYFISLGLFTSGQESLFLFREQTLYHPQLTAIDNNFFLETNVGLPVPDKTLTEILTGVNANWMVKKQFGLGIKSDFVSKFSPQNSVQEGYVKIPVTLKFSGTKSGFMFSGGLNIHALVESKSESTEPVDGELQPAATYIPDADLRFSYYMGGFNVNLGVERAMAREGTHGAFSKVINERLVVAQANYSFKLDNKATTLGALYKTGEETKGLHAFGTILLGEALILGAQYKRDLGNTTMHEYWFSIGMQSDKFQIAYTFQNRNTILYSNIHHARLTYRLN